MGEIHHLRAANPFVVWIAQGVGKTRSLHVSLCRLVEFSLPLGMSRL